MAAISIGRCTVTTVSACIIIGEVGVVVAGLRAGWAVMPAIIAIPAVAAFTTVMPVITTVAATTRSLATILFVGIESRGRPTTTVIAVAFFVALVVAPIGSVLLLLLLRLLSRLLRLPSLPSRVPIKDPHKV